ncbi:hypothetical protein MHBO_002520 [Bonamia ostreae]|uniref:RecA family profile 1 domain-containing protein n=1 Tax=Bonamia ostreae TaxID=126728 RepID=A0ABV2AML3_9EUKA
MPLVTLDQLKFTPLSTGCDKINQFLGGGLKLVNFQILKGLTEITGEAGTGKTQFCLQCAISAILNNNSDEKVIYLHSEGKFPVFRLKNLIEAILKSDTTNISSLDKMADETEKILSRIEIIAFSDSNKLLQSVNTTIPFLAQTKKIVLVVIDSVTAIFSNIAKKSERSFMLLRMSEKLKTLSFERKVPFLVTNQVVDIFPGDLQFQESLQGSFLTSNRRVKPSMGLTWSHCVDRRIFFKKKSDIKVVLYREMEIGFASDTKLSKIETKN